MDIKTQSSGGNPSQKHWERAGSSSSPTPSKPPQSGNTSDVVEASGTPKPGETVSTAGRNTVNSKNVARPIPTRPWAQQGQIYGGYGSSLNYNTGYQPGMYGSYGGFGGYYAGGRYGNMYRGGYGGMYGGGRYNNGFGGPVCVYGMGTGDPHSQQGPDNPSDAPSSPPSFWISLLRVMHGVVTVFGRVAMLVDQNTQALHMFMTALLQLFDHSGLLYGELARFVLRLLGVRTKPRKVHLSGSQGLPGPHNPYENQKITEAPKALPSDAWDSSWGDKTNH